MPLSRGIMLGLWAACAAGVVGCVVLGLVGRRPVMAFRESVRSVTSYKSGLVIALLIWAWAGWHFFAR